MNGDFFIGVISLYTLFKKGRHTYLIESYFSLIQNYRRFSIRVSSIILKNSFFSF